MAWGNKTEGQIRQLIAKNKAGKVGERPGYFERPRLGPLRWYLEAFDDLGADRSQGGAIRWTAIDRYAERAGIDGEAFERFRSIIRTLDDTLLKIMRDDQPTLTQKPAQRRRPIS
jgi:hypothetical protein